MPVNTTHACYDDRLSEWQLVRDCIAGKNALICGGEKYLPRLSEQDEEGYRAYQTRAKYFNATARTLESMTGILFRKQPEIVTSLPDQPILWDVDLANNPLTQYAARIAKEVCSVGRAGTLIDWSDTEERPYVSFYRAEDILNWRMERIDGRQTLTMLVLRENIEEESADLYCPKAVEQYRVIRMDLSEGRQIVAEVYRAVAATGRGRNKADTTFLLSEAYTLQRRGQALEEIPFVFHNATESGPQADKPPLYDIADLNVGHFRNSADLENGRHVCGVPTPVAVGFGTDTKMYLGTAYAWTSDDTSAKASFLEFSGQGLAALEKALEETAQQMEALGAKMIAPPTATEAYGTVALRNAAENSAITQIADQISDSMTRVLGWLEWWQGTAPAIADTKAEFHVHKDFNAVALTPEEMTGLTALWQQNAISYDTLFQKLQRGEVIPEGRTMEEEQSLIEENPPMPAPTSVPIDPTTGKPLPPPGAKKDDPEDDTEDDAEE